MELIEITRSLSAATAAPLYFIHGPERFMVADFVTRLKDAVLSGPMADFNYTRRKADELSGSGIVGEARSLPMMAPRRLIIIDDADKLKSADMEPLENYMENPAPETCLVLIGTKFDLRKGLFAKANRKKLVLSADALKENEILPFIRARATTRRVVLEKGADAALSVAVGPDASALDDAIERLGLYSGGKPVEADHVATVVSSIRQNKVFDLTDALGSRNSGRAMALLEEFLGNREEPLRLLALVSRHMRQLILARVYAPQNLPQGDLAKLLGVPPFAVSKLLSQSRIFNGTQLENALMRIARADVELKSSRRPAGLILEDAIMDLCLSD